MNKEIIRFLTVKKIFNFLPYQMSEYECMID
jgi:hypothetical protein